MTEQNDSLHRRLDKYPIAAKSVNELLRVYEDLEKLIQSLTKPSVKEDEQPINVKKLIEQLSDSKLRLERKIGNTLLLEKDQLRYRLRSLMKKNLPN